MLWTNRKPYASRFVGVYDAAAHVRRAEAAHFERAAHLF